MSEPSATEVSWGNSIAAIAFGWLLGVASTCVAAWWLLS
jgi:hypothetical protein